jgi:hypothetical protein
MKRSLPETLNDSQWDTVLRALMHWEAVCLDLETGGDNELAEIAHHDLQNIATIMNTDGDR